jgi:hypothetical protein
MTMSRIKTLETMVEELYLAKNAGRDEWADWLYPNHVLIVGDIAVELAKKYDAQIDLCKASALLHDIADAEMSRFSPGHEEHSMAMARDLLSKAGFTAEEIVTVVDDALKFHSCKDGLTPKTLVGKVLSTADALAHLNTNFYTYTTQNLMSGRPESQKREWAIKKIPRDYYDKIAFDEVREDAKASFEKLTATFTNA